MIKLVIFDLDGTLLNTIDDISRCTNHILAQYELPTHNLNAYKYFVGKGMETLIERATPNNISSSLKARVLADFLAYYQKHNTDYTAPYSGIIEMLETLQQRGIAVAIASNKTHAAMPALIAHYFPTITFLAATGHKKGVPLKPDPTIVEEIINMSDVSKENILYVGDTQVDMQTAEAAQLTSVGVLWGFRDRNELETAGAKHIIEKPNELLNIVFVNKSLKLKI